MTPAFRPERMVMPPNLKIVRRAYMVAGTSWRGNVTPRDGKAVTCGHKHTTLSEAIRCRKKIQITRPGRCQDYRVIEVVWMKEKRP